MFSLPDFKQKQILFIQTKELGKNHIKLANDNLVLEFDDKIVQKISLHKVFCVFLIGDTTITTKILDKLSAFGVSIYFLKNNLSVYTSFEPSSEANFLVRQRQYTTSEEEELFYAKKIIKNKIKNQVRLLKKQDCSSEVITKIESLETDKAQNFQELLAIEGAVAKLFFKNYFPNWYKRLPRAKQDIYNLLLDIGYTYLFNFVDSILRIFGFDTYKGIYHKLFFQRKSLTCDLMEIFRCIIDRSLLKAYNLKQIDEKDFEYKNHAYQLSWKNSSKYSAIFLKAILEYKVEIYEYIQAYYRYFMRPNKYKMPIFNINKNYHK
jgi:CRISPR-associated protein Cas1